MWTYIHTDELYHHGVKGMKWGVRKKRDSDGQSRGQRIVDAAKRIGGAFVDANSGGITSTPKLPNWINAGRKTDGANDRPKTPKWLDAGTKRDFASTTKPRLDPFAKTDGPHKKSKLEKLVDSGNTSANTKKSRKVSSDTALSELEKYKKSQRIKNAVSGTLTGVAIAGLAVAAAPAIYLGQAIVRNIWDSM